MKLQYKKNSQGYNVKLSLQFLDKFNNQVLNMPVTEVKSRCYVDYFNMIYKQFPP